MRWIFLLLLTVNLGILIWSVQRQSDSEPHLTQEAGVGNLRLVKQSEKSLARLLPQPDEAGDEPEPALPEPQREYPTVGTVTATQPTPGVMLTGAKESFIKPADTSQFAAEAQGTLAGAATEQPQQPVEDIAEATQPMSRITASSESEPTAERLPLPDGGRKSLLPDDIQAGEDRVSPQPAETANNDNDAPAEPSLSDTEDLAVVLPSPDAEIGDDRLSPGMEYGDDETPVDEPQSLTMVDAASIMEAEPKNDPVINEVEPPAAQVAKAVEICGVLGPIEDDALARSLLNALEDEVVEASLRRETQQKAQGYWVIVPPLPNRRAAIAMERRLRAAGESDVMRFYKGKMRNAVSLGMYTRRRNAENRRQRIADKGFDAEVRARTRAVQVLHIDYRTEEGPNDQAVREVREQYPDLDHNRQTCRQIVRP